MPVADKSQGRRTKTILAAQVYNISPQTLWGVYGTESGYGANLGPSSAGAVGPFQFLPSTAQGMGSSAEEVMDFDKAVLLAAKYLKQLGADDDPNSAKTAEALNRYSGGGGSDYVNKVKQNGADLKDPGGFSPVEAVKDTADTVGDVAGGVGDFANWITNPSSWLRIGKGSLGFAFLVIGTGALVFIIAKPVAKTAIGVTGTGRAVKAAAKTVTTNAAKETAKTAATATKEVAK